jgi:DNA-binding SARP family transcriptional activator
MHIRLLGLLEIEDGQRRLGPNDLGGRKPKQLLEILLTEHDRIVPKERIAELLWPDELPQNVSATIDTYVSVLRRHLEPASIHPRDSRYIRRVRPGYLFDSSEVEVDIDRFQALFIEGQRAYNNGDWECTERVFTAAIDCYHGAYLEDEPQATWALAPRERFKRTYINLLISRVEISIVRARFGDGLRLCEQILEHDPTCEEAFRQAMLCSYALGRQDEAFRIFQRCCKTLIEELGVNPMPETDELYHRILQGIPVQHLLAYMMPNVRSIKTESIEIPFLGRKSEFAEIIDAWQKTERGAQLVMVQGEAGIGKSRLVTEFLRKEELRCGRAKCTELERDLPFSGIAAALADLFNSLSTQDLEQALKPNAAVVELIPELENKIQISSIASPLPPEAARVHLLDSIVMVLRTLSPLVLFLDDLQWADASTVQALGRILQRAGDSSIMLLSTLRTTETAGNALVRHLTDAARADYRLCTIELEPLPLIALDALLPLGVDPGELWVVTGGHPLFLAERLRARQGKRLDEAILSRCRATSESAQRLLEFTSVLERPFRPGLLAAMLEQDEVTIVPDCEELLKRMLLVESAGGLNFPHDLVRHAIYSKMSGPRREALHRKALQALKAEGAPIAELASHALAGGVWADAVRYSTVAGNQALEMYANAEAAVHFKRALATLESHPGLVEPAQFETLLIQYARAMIVLSETDEALKSLTQALVSARSRGNLRAETEVSHWLGLTHWSAWIP